MILFPTIWQLHIVVFFISFLLEGFWLSVLLLYSSLLLGYLIDLSIDVLFIFLFGVICFHSHFLIHEVFCSIFAHQLCLAFFIVFTVLFSAYLCIVTCFPPVSQVFVFPFLHCWVNFCSIQLRFSLFTVLIGSLSSVHLCDCNLVWIFWGNQLHRWVFSGDLRKVCVCLMFHSSEAVIFQ